MSTSPPVDLGVCWGTPSGQDLSMPSYMASGNLVVAEATLRRWTTSRGEQIDDPDLGFNLNDLISADLSPTDIAYAQQQAAAEATKDDRVLRASVTLTFAEDTIIVAAALTTANGPFKFTAAISAVSVSLLLVQP